MGLGNRLRHYIEATGEHIQIGTESHRCVSEPSTVCVVVLSPGRRSFAPAGSVHRPSRHVHLSSSEVQFKVLGTGLKFRVGYRV